MTINRGPCVQEIGRRAGTASERGEVEKKMDTEGERVREGMKSPIIKRLFEMDAASGFLDALPAFMRKAYQSYRFA